MTPPSTIGRYVIDGELGRGGMGVVYSAHDPQLDRPVAVKIIRFESEAGLVAAPDLEARFLREARLAARLHHPSVATVFDAGRDGDSLFLVMERVDGQSLAKRLQRGDFPSPAESLRMVAQVADALVAAHAVGIIHRDIKPANILLTRTGGVKVSDFGVAKAVGDSTELTHTGSVLGSPAYMAPEQVQGLEVDGRADLFSLGVVLYELLLHRKPFPADTVTTLIYQILHQDPFADQEGLRAVGADISAFLRSALAKLPDDRVPDAATFGARARELAGRAPATFGTETTARLPSRAVIAPLAVPVVATAPPLRTKRAVWPWVVAAAAIGFVALLWLVATRQPPPPPSLAATSSTEAPSTAVAAASSAATPGSTPPATVPATPEMVPAAPPATAAPPVAAPLPVPRPAPTSPPPSPPVHAAPAVDAPAAEATPAPAPAPGPAPFPVSSVAYSPPAAVSGTFRCRKGAEFNVSPEAAHVLVDGRDIGIADDWDGSGGGKELELAPGEFVACFVAPQYKTACVKLVAGADGDDEICDVDTELDRDRRAKTP